MSAQKAATNKTASAKTSSRAQSSRKIDGLRTKTTYGKPATSHSITAPSGRTSRVTAPAGRTARVAADDPLSTQRVEYLATIFTRAQIARWIGVSASQTSRWASGDERPGPTAAPALIDLEHIYSRARLVWGEEAARIWLESANAFLSGARPLDVLLTDGPARVLEALDAEMWGGAA